MTPSSLVYQLAPQQVMTPNTPHLWTHWPVERSQVFHQTGCLMGLQWCTHQRQRSMESGIQDQTWIIWTYCHVFRHVQLPHNLPNYDGWLLGDRLFEFITGLSTSMVSLVYSDHIYSTWFILTAHYFPHTHIAHTCCPHPFFIPVPVTDFYLSPSRIFCITCTTLTPMYVLAICR